MDCNTARLLLEFAHPQTAELDAEESQALARHLADCPDCGLQSRSERAADDCIGRAMRAVPVPDGLRDRLRGRLSGERAISIRRRAIRAAAMAAMVLLTLGGGIYWFLSRPLPDVDLDAFAARLDAMPRTLPQVEAAFLERHGKKVMAWGPFNYALLTDYGLADFQGQKVPYVQFTQGTQNIRVFLLENTQFNLESLPEHPTGPITVIRSGDRRFAYLVLFLSGHSLEPFLTRDPEPAA